MDRRTIISAATALGIGGGLLAARQTAAADAPASSPPASPPDVVRARDGTELFCRDWGSGAPVLFLAAWGLPSEAWQYQMAPLADQGFRCIAFDRRSHGRSSDPGRGYDLDTLAGDVASVIEHFDLRDATLVGHSLGGAEAVRYLSTAGDARIRRLVLVAPTTPMLLRTEDNPDGFPPAMIEGWHAAMQKDFPGLVAANIKPFVVPATSQGMIDWIVAMITSTPLKALLDCNLALNRADFRAELPKLTVPTLILQGDADASAPLALTGRKTAALMKTARLEVYEGAPHGLIYTHAERVTADIAAFARS